MEREITLIGTDDYEYNIDALDVIIIKNKLGGVFEFKPEEIRSIAITPHTEEKEV